PFATIFSNSHIISKGGNTDYAFEISRAYLGYGYNFSKTLSGKINIDIGTPEVTIGDSLEGKTSLDYTAYLKTASLIYKKEKLVVDFGLIGLKQFKESENIWGRRYIYKSFQDNVKMGSSADLGLTVTYQFLKFLSADLTVINGEGYKELQSDSIFKYGAGVTANPLEGLTLRLYCDLMGEDDFQNTIATFAGYQNDKLSAGFEYNIQNNNKMKSGYNFSGFSLFGSYQFIKQFEVFARYDNLSSVILAGASDAWNIKKDGQAFIAGIEYTPVKGIKISPNYQGWFSAKSGSNAISGFYLNFELKL
ncbi:MAG: hypothetical protein JXB17_01815, partial [Bacteroidales bacterium]|nr:hypothetical protein [Bacteroidales bacterium]